MEDTQIIELYFKRDEAALQETNAKYGAYCFRTVSEGNISVEYIRDNLSDHTPYDMLNETRGFYLYRTFHCFDRNR